MALRRGVPGKLAGSAPAASLVCATTLRLRISQGTEQVHAAWSTQVQALSMLRLRYRELLHQAISEAPRGLTPEEVSLVPGQLSGLPRQWPVPVAAICGGGYCSGATQCKLDGNRSPLLAVDLEARRTSLIHTSNRPSFPQPCPDATCQAPQPAFHGQTPILPFASARPSAAIGTPGAVNLSVSGIQVH